MSLLNQQLPFDRLLYPPPPNGFSTPPFIPNVGCPPQLQYMIPHIATEVANEAAAKSMMHCGRVFTYNQLSANNFNNSEFAMAVATSIDLLVLGLTKNIYRAAEEGYKDAVSKTLGALTSLNIANNQQLQQVVPPEVLNDVNVNINVFSQMQQEVLAIKNGQVQQPQFQQPNGYGMQQPQVVGFQQPQGYGLQQPNVYGMQQPQVIGFQQPQQYNQYQAPQINRPNQQGTGRQFGVQASSNVFVVNSGVNQPGTGSVRTFANQEEKKFSLELKPTVTNEPEIKLGSTSSSLITWTPNDKQLYPVTVSTNTQQHDVKLINENGKSFTISYARQLKENEMNRDQHSITSFGNKYTTVLPMAYNTRADAINENVSGFMRITGNDIIAAKEATVEKAEPATKEEVEKIAEINSVISSKMLIDSSFNGLIVNSKINQIKATGSCDPGNIYCSFGMYGNPIVMCSDSDRSSTFSELSQATSHKEVVDIIESLLNKLGKTTSDIYLAMRINNYMTDAINLVIRNNLSIPGLFIESYKEDVLGLADHLGYNYSSLHKEIFLDMESILLKLCLGECSNDLQELADGFLDGDNTDDVVSIEFLVANYSFTHLSFHSSELNVKPYSECASLIDSTTPVLYKICTTLLKQENECKEKIYRRFLITEDDVIYEISKGWLMKNAITVSEVKHLK